MIFAQRKGFFPFILFLSQKEVSVLIDRELIFSTFVIYSPRPKIFQKKSAIILCLMLLTFFHTRDVQVLQYLLYFSI